MEKQYLINGRIINPTNQIDEIGGLIIDNEGKIQASGKDVSKENDQIRNSESVINFKDTSVDSIMRFIDLD